MWWAVSSYPSDCHQCKIAGGTGYNSDPWAAAWGASSRASTIRNGNWRQHRHAAAARRWARPRGDFRPGCWRRQDFLSAEGCSGTRANCTSFVAAYQDGALHAKRGCLAPGLGLASWVSRNFSSLVVERNGVYESKPRQSQAKCCAYPELERGLIFNYASQVRKALCNVGVELLRTNWVALQQGINQLPNAF